MPIKPGRPCSYPRCPLLATDKGYCDQHRKQMQHVIDQQRGSSAERGYDYRWQVQSKLFLNEHPLCEICLKDGRVTVATCVDHIKPHRGDQQLFWDRSNWQAACDHCHNAKTARGE